MDYETFHTYREILDTPQALKKIIEKNWSDVKKLADELFDRNIDSIIFTGCGASYYAGVVASFLLNFLTELRGQPIPSSEFYFYPIKLGGKNPAVIAVSRSGETTETNLATKAAIKRGYFTIGITINPDSTLVKESNLAIILNTGDENSVVMTKVYTSIVFLFSILALELASNKSGVDINKFRRFIREIPKAVKEILEKRKKLQLLAEKLSNYNHFIVLGSGPNYGTALEGNLIIKETNYVATETYTTLEFRHGPISSVNENMVVIGLVPESGHFQEELAVLDEIVERGANVFKITNVVDDSDEGMIFKTPKTHFLLSPITLIVPIQLSAFYMSVRRGLNPDKPRYLQKIVKLKSLD